MKKQRKYLIAVAVVLVLAIIIVLYMKDKDQFLNNPEKLASPDVPGSEKEIKPELLRKLRKLSQLAGQKLTITSGLRSPAHNRKVGGVSNSAHLTGEAADLAADDPVTLAKLAYQAGFRRIGVGRKYIHVDVADGSTGKPTPAIWTYPGSGHSKSWLQQNIPS